MPKQQNFSNLDYGIKKETVYSDYICRLQNF